MHEDRTYILVRQWGNVEKGFPAKAFDYVSDRELAAALDYCAASWLTKTSSDANQQWVQDALRIVPKHVEPLSDDETRLVASVVESYRSRGEVFPVPYWVVFHAENSEEQAFKVCKVLMSLVGFPCPCTFSTIKKTDLALHSWVNLERQLEALRNTKVVITPTMRLAAEAEDVSRILRRESKASGKKRPAGPRPSLAAARALQSLEWVCEQRSDLVPAAERGPARTCRPGDHPAYARRPGVGRPGESGHGARSRVLL